MKIHQLSVFLADKPDQPVAPCRLLAVEAPDRPGRLAHLMEVFAFGRQGREVPIFRFDAADTAIRLLDQAGCSVLESAEVYRRIEP